MKAKHRHELHTNFLADRAWKLLQSMRSGSRSNASLLSWVLVLLTVGTYALWQYTASAGHSERSDGWLALGDAVRDPAQSISPFFGLAESATGTIPGRSALFEVARRDLQAGNENLYVRGDLDKRKTAIKMLVQARDLYLRLSKECVDSLLLAQEALFGAAKAEESLVDVHDPDQPDRVYGNLDRAIEYYRNLVRYFPQGAFAKAAKSRLEEIEANKHKVEGFYSELNQLAGPKEKPKSAGQADLEGGSGLNQLLRPKEKPKTKDNTSKK
jgi:hypothetical protein